MSTPATIVFLIWLAPMAIVVVVLLAAFVYMLWYEFRQWLARPRGRRKVRIKWKEPLVFVLICLWVFGGSYLIDYLDY